jgi:hypothetical protein
VSWLLIGALIVSSAIIVVCIVVVSYWSCWPLGDPLNIPVHQIKPTIGGSLEAHEYVVELPVLPPILLSECSKLATDSLHAIPTNWNTTSSHLCCLLIVATIVQLCDS